MCIVVPFAIRKLPGRPGAAVPLFLYFAGIGAGFMLVEVSQMERLIVRLGHPVYALSVVLFSLLLSSGVGSYSTQKIFERDPTRAAALRWGGLLCALCLFGVVTPMAAHLLEGSATPVRIAAAVAVLLPLGFFMGMPFPIGMQVAAQRPSVQALTPWLWGINGAFSVLASVLAIVIALTAGISASFWVGVGCYLAAAFGLAWCLRANAIQGTTHA